jgi:hypothetical protein
MPTLPLSDASLHEALEPTVLVLRAFKQASRTRAILDAWGDTELWRKLTALMLAVLVITIAVLSILCESNLLLVTCGLLTVLAALFFRLGIVDRYAPLKPWRAFDETFVLNYRFRRYLKFRDSLAKAGFDKAQLEKVRVVLAQETQFKGKTNTTGAATTTLLAVVTSILTTLSTRDDVVQSGLSFIILTVALFAVFAAWLLRQGIPTSQDQRTLLESFLTWYELELVHFSELTQKVGRVEAESTKP